MLNIVNAAAILLQNGPGSQFVKNHESQSRTMKLQMLESSCDQTVHLKTDSNTFNCSILKLKLNSSHNTCHRNYTNRIFPQLQLMNRAIFASNGTHSMNYFAFLRTQDAEVTEAEAFPRVEFVQLQIEPLECSWLTPFPPCFGSGSISWGRATVVPFLLIEAHNLVFKMQSIVYLEKQYSASWLAIAR